MMKTISANIMPKIALRDEGMLFIPDNLGNKVDFDQNKIIMLHKMSSGVNS